MASSSSPPAHFKILSSDKFGLRTASQDCHRALPQTWSLAALHSLCTCLPTCTASHASLLYKYPCDDVPWQIFRLHPRVTAPSAKKILAFSKLWTLDDWAASVGSQMLRCRGPNKNLSVQLSSPSSPPDHPDESASRGCNDLGVRQPPVTSPPERLDVSSSPSIFPPTDSEARRLHHLEFGQDDTGSVSKCLKTSTAA